MNEICARVHNSVATTALRLFHSSQFDSCGGSSARFTSLAHTAMTPSALVATSGGPKGHSGTAVCWSGIVVLAMDNVLVHIYGQKETRLGRKMGQYHSSHSRETGNYCMKVNQISKHPKCEIDG